MTLELAGTPAVAVITTPFERSARLMCGVCGLPGHQFASVSHPFASADAPRLADMAAAAGDQIEMILTRHEPSTGQERARDDDGRL